MDTEQLLERKDGNPTAYEVMCENKDGEIRTGEIMKSDDGKTNFTAADKETNHEMPARMLYQGRKLRFNRGRLWLLQSMGGFTPGELASFREKYQDELTIDEIEVISLLMKAMSGDSEAKSLVWEMHKEMFKATKQIYIEQMKAQLSQGQSKSVTRLESMLEQIGNAIGTEKS